jgi:hypothetical protein
MQRTVRAHEKPSRISQGLVVCLSIAVVLAAGRLATTIIFSRYATASAVDATDTTSASVSVESVSSEPHEPPVAAPVNAASFEPLPRDDESTSATLPRSALPPAPLADPSSAAIRNPGSAPWSMATAVPDVDFRGIPAKLPQPSAPPQATEGGVASAPVPRPRPLVESEDVQPEPNQSRFSAFDLFTDRQR